MLVGGRGPGRHINTRITPWVLRFPIREFQKSPEFQRSGCSTPGPQTDARRSRYSCTSRMTKYRTLYYPSSLFWDIGPLCWALMEVQVYQGPSYHFHRPAEDPATWKLLASLPKLARRLCLALQGFPKREQGPFFWLS